MSRRPGSIGAASLLVCLMVTGLWAPVASRAATIISVPGDYPTIQAAIDAASAGDTIRVSPGTYFETIDYHSKAITVESVAGPEDTIIDAGQSGPVATVVTMAATAGQMPVLRGFTIQNGNGYPGPGGVYTTGGAPLIERNWIVDNDGCDGNGIAARFSGATIRDNLIARNREGSCSGGVGGGGIMVGGAGTVTIEGNTIEDNSAAQGGGITLASAGAPEVIGNLIRRNHGGSAGGGLSLFNQSDAHIANNLIVGNDAAKGGGLSVLVPASTNGPSVINNTFVHNEADAGAAILTDGFHDFSRYTNNVLVGATTQATFECGTSYRPIPPIITFNDVYNTTGPAYSPACGSPTGTDGNLSVDPRFVDPIAGDYHLRADSPLIDAGSDTSAPTTDLDGDARPHDGDEDGTATVDIGYDEAIDPILLVPRTLAFEDSVATVAGPTLPIGLSNLGTGPVSVTSVSKSGTDAGDFAITSDTCTGATMPAGASCSISVRFSPTDVDERTATVTIVGPGAVGSRTVSLTGTGLDPVLVTPAGLAFGDVALGSTSGPATVSVFDYGDAPMPVSGVSIGGPNAADFSIAAEDCTATPIPVAMACAVSVTFEPSSLGARSATLTIAGPAPVGTRTVPLTGTGTVPVSGVAWGGTAFAGPAYTWNAGNALATTTQSGAQRLHLAYATHRIGSKWAADAGPYAGIYYTRALSGATWSTPVRVNPTTQHAERVGLAASGSRVYVTWVTQTKVTRYSGTAPRVLYVRTNTNHGTSTSWTTAIRLTGTTGRVDYPTIAATGSDVHVAWTDAVTGTIKVATSRNAGTTWTTRSIGTATTLTTDGRSGVPSVAAFGATVAIVWIADPAGTIKGRVSLDHGATWGPLETVGVTPLGFASVAVRGTRVAVAWSTLDDVVVRLRSAGTWGTPMAIASLEPGANPVPYAPMVVLQDPDRIGVAWSEELDAASRSNLRWTESTDGGATWYQTQTIATTSTTRGYNDWASVIWPTAGARSVVWNGWTANSSAFRLFFRKGTGTPTGLAVSATEWAPDADPALSPDGANGDRPMVSRGPIRTPG